MTPETVFVPDPSRCPYLGLRPFTIEDADLYYGRQEQVDDLVRVLGRSHFVAVLGSSGVGKSSLVGAGLMPRLYSGLLTSAGPRWYVARFRPGNRPLFALAEGLAVALREFSQGTVQFDSVALEEDLRFGKDDIVTILDRHGFQARNNLLVMADQFEEIFQSDRTSKAQERADDGNRLVKLLLQASEDPRVYSTLTMRSEYLGNCAMFRGLPERINEGIYIVPRMRRSQIEEAIVEPAAAGGAEIHPALLQRLLNDTMDHPDQLPILQHLLFRMWQRMTIQPGHERILTMSDYEAMGGWNRAISDHANEIFESLTPTQQSATEWLFRRITFRDDDGRVTRDPATLEKIQASVPDPSVREQVPAAIKAYRDNGACFLTTDPDRSLSPETRVDIMHESLIRQWDRLVGAQMTTSDSRSSIWSRIWGVMRN